MTLCQESLITPTKHERMIKNHHLEMALDLSLSLCKRSLLYYMIAVATICELLASFFSFVIAIGPLERMYKERGKSLSMVQPNDRLYSNI